MAQANQSEALDMVACLPLFGIFTLASGNATGYDGPPVELVLNLRGGNAAAGAMVQLWDDRHNLHNHWRLARYGDHMAFSIQSVASGLFLCVPYGNTALGARPSLFALPPAVDFSFAWQLWRFPCRTTFVVESRDPHFPQCRWWTAPLWEQDSHVGQPRQPRFSMAL